MGKELEDAEVVDRLRGSIVAAVCADEVVDWWVEDYLSWYVVVGGIPEENWAASGWDCVRRDNPNVGSGRRGPLVVGRAWKNLSLKLEVRDAVAVGVVVKL